MVQVRKHLINRVVCYEGKRWVPDGESPQGLDPDDQDRTEVIWPTWPATLAEEIATSGSPLEDLQRGWDAAIGRLRDSAKWMSAVLGAALASVIPAAPLSGFSQRHLPFASAVLGLVGLLALSVTLLLVLQVMRPQSVSYDDIQDAKLPGGLRGRARGLVRRRRPHSHALESPLYRWQHTIEAHPDLYLPCGIYSLRALRQLMTVEEITLVALSRAREPVDDDLIRSNLNDAQAARAARLYELRTAAARIVAVGMYYNARARSTLATYWGVILGFIGIAAVITAVVHSVG